MNSLEEHNRLLKQFEEIIGTIEGELASIADLKVKSVMLFTLKEVKQFVYHGEESLAFELLCSNMYEVNYPLSQSLYDKIFDLAKDWSGGEEYLAYLKKIVK